MNQQAYVYALKKLRNGRRRHHVEQLLVKYWGIHYMVARSIVDKAIRQIGGR